MFDLNKCASAVAVAMVGTIRNGDDAKRFAERAVAEGFSNISDLIAADAVKQALALRAAIDVADPLINATSFKLKGVEDGEIQVERVPTPARIDINAAPSPVTLSAETASLTDIAQAFGETPLAVPPAPSAEVQADTTTTSTTSATASDVEVDSRGLPWDGRIHASTKTRLAKDNSWKLKRGLDPQYVEQIEAELRQVMAIPSAPTVEPTIAPPAPTETQGLHPGQNAFNVATVNHLTAQGNAAKTAEVSTPQTGASSSDYSTWGMPELMRGLTAKKIDQAYVAQVVQQLGVPSIMALGARKDLIPLVAETLEL